ncbi:IS3 family transposase [Microbacterium sp.]|uniref:IS3 family transposase n=1 Tax=Microbacterium sp. TaxID=51671 RepID=UPI003C785F43
MVACRALGVSPSWYHKWRHGDASAQHVRRAQLEIAIQRLFAAHRGTYGSPRIISVDLREEGWTVSVNTVAAVMAELGLPHAVSGGEADHEAGSGKVAGFGPDQPRFRGAGSESEVVRRRH